MLINLTMGIAMLDCVVDLVVGLRVATMLTITWLEIFVASIKGWVTACLTLVGPLMSTVRLSVVHVVLRVVLIILSTSSLSVVRSSHAIVSLISTMVTTVSVSVVVAVALMMERDGNFYLPRALGVLTVVVNVVDGLSSVSVLMMLFGPPVLLITRHMSPWVPLKSSLDTCSNHGSDDGCDL